MTRYGPHRPADAPDSVLVLHGNTTVEPLPAALVRQRRQLNQLAAGVLVEAGPHRPIGRPIPLVATAATARGRARLVQCAIAARRGQAVPLMWDRP